MVDKSGKTSHQIHGLSDPEIGRHLPSIPLRTHITTILFLTISMGLFFIPFLFIALGFYLLYNLYLSIFALYLIISCVLIFYPIGESSELLQNRILFGLFNYFAYRHVSSKETRQYITNHLLQKTETFKVISTNSDRANNSNSDGIFNGNSDSKHSDCDHNETVNIQCDRPMIFISIPHGILPWASFLSPLVSPDIFGEKVIGTVASVLFYIPFIRNLVYWYGARSVSRSSINHLLSGMGTGIGRHVGLVCDGIKGMFVNSRGTEHVLLKYRKGVAKIALQNGAHVVPTYGFGNTKVYNAIFDKWGWMKWLSSKLRISVILFYGRWYTPIPKRIPLLFCIGKPVYNRYCYRKIKDPTQEQIDEYHRMIMEGTKKMFDECKTMYQWQDRELVFI